ncbi:unnamed protein product [Phytophthora lilii]|uniref:Unnamed protein product n=1 Tax=Phytophthora lilii TaxID=2077276 RepID=A0A9W6TGZ5_9STRA|nr:unnamed protein product [Phytophthora lilii]
MKSWDDDGVGGGPSSMEVLLKWLSMSGNAMRWRRSAGKGDGSRIEMTNEIYDMLLSYGIYYRSLGGIGSKLWLLEHQLDQAENWLKSRGLRHFDVSRKTEDAVLHMCPYYPEIKPLLRPKRAAPIEPVARATSYSSEESDTDARDDAGCYSSSDDDVELPKVGSKRPAGGPHAPDQDNKRARLQDQLDKVKLEDTKCVAVLEAEPNERREFFKLELQIKRDQAILVRAKARKEMMDIGIPLNEINRLLPL